MTFIKPEAQVLFALHVNSIRNDQNHATILFYFQKSEMKPFSRMRKWTPVNWCDLKTFLALCIIMGLVHKSDLEKYWDTREMTETPAFGKYMSKDRFLSILSNFHIVDNRNEKCADEIGHDPLYKVRPFIKMLTNNFGNFSAESELAFDEGTCPFKGRLKFKVYNPAKPNKFGIKIFQICESSTGYVLGFDIYCRSDKSHSCQQFAQLVTDDSLAETSEVVL